MNSSRTCQRCGSPLDPKSGVTTCDKCRSFSPLDETLAYGSSTIGLAESNSNLGPYRLLRQLGQGGMGSVYEAEHVQHHRRVALKVLNHRLESDEFRRRFLREGRLAATVNHPNTVYVFGTDEIDGKPVIAMELVQGGSLQDRVQAEGPLPVRAAVDLSLQLIAGLQAAEAKGVIHRDVKPSNCFLSLDGTLKIGDFGLSVSITPQGESLITQSGVFLGTPAFSSPEQLQGQELDLRSDIYSFGVTLYYMLTGRIPFQKSHMVQLMAAVLQQPAPAPTEIRPEIPAGLAKIVLRCLEKKPSLRFPNYDELRRALLPYSSQAPTPATLGLRVVAYGVDFFLRIGFCWLLALTWFQDLAESWAAIDTLTSSPSRDAWLPAFAWFLLTMGYFIISEGVWGCSLGKAISGLRTVGSRPGPLGILRAGLRTTVFLADYWTIWLCFAFGQLVGQGNSDSENSWIIDLVIAIFLLLISTMRRRNGYAGVHELISGTRVVSTLRDTKRSSLPVGQTLRLVSNSLSGYAEPNVGGLLTATHDHTQAELDPRVGPYRILNSEEPEVFKSVLPGYDDRLRRIVWIRKLDRDSSAFPLPLREAGRRGRLRWLNGKYNGSEEGWEAYEAPSGLPLLALLGNPQPWQSVRFWLYDLAQELDASLLDGTFPAELELARVWITSDGHIMLLDFSLTRSSSQPARPDEPFGQTKVNDEQRSPNGPSRSPHWRARLFLKQVAMTALTGEISNSEQVADADVLVQLPISVHRLLNQWGRSKQDSLSTDELARLTQTAVSVTMLSRVRMLIYSILPLLVIAFMAFPEGMDKTNFRQLDSRGDFKTISMEDFVPFIYGSLGYLMFFVALPSCFSIVVFGNSLLLRALGIEVASKRGSPASRKLKLVRSLLLWGIITVTTAIVQLVAVKLTAIVGGVTIILLPLHLCLIGYLFLAKRPVHDRLLGTCLVPE